MPFPGGAGCCLDSSGGVQPAGESLKLGIIGVSEAPSPAGSGPFSAVSCLIGAAKGQGTVPTHHPVPWVCYVERELLEQFGASGQEEWEKLCSMFLGTPDFIGRKTSMAATIFWATSLFFFYLIR